MSKLLNYIFKKQREDFDKLTKQRNREHEFPKGVLRMQNVRYYPDNAPAHVMDVYRPEGTQEFPIIINVHGGGLVMGNKEFNKYFCAHMAKLGYVVFSVEYRLAPEVQIYDQLRDVAKAMDFVKENAHAFGGDLSNVYMLGDSAGAYLIVYSLALQKNRNLRKAACVRPSNLRVNAAGLISGMFYTTRFDKIGLFMAKTLYGKYFRRRAIGRYTNPDNPGVVCNMPPCILISSKHDNLLNYTEDFASALASADIEHELSIFEQDDKKLSHAFPVFNPEYEESKSAMLDIHNFFKEHRIEGELYV